MKYGKKTVVLMFVLAMHCSDGWSYQWPVSGNPESWSYGYTFAQQVGSRRHLGTDIMVSPLTPVRAPHDCTVFISKLDNATKDDPGDGYGYYVVFSYRTPSGEERVSGIGHLSRRKGYEAKGPGNYQAGEILGYVGYDDENGLGGPHIHWFDYGAPPDGTYHYHGYTGKHGEDADYSTNGEYLGGKFTDPIKLWTSFIAGQHTPSYPPYTPIIFSSPTVYLLANGQLWPIPNPETYCLLGFGRKNNWRKPDWSHLVKLGDDRKSGFTIRSDAIIGRDRQKTTYRVVDKVGPNTGTQRTIPTANLYQLGNDKRLHRIENWQHYLALGYDPNSRDIVDITQALFDFYGEGEPLSTGSPNSNTGTQPYTYDDNGHTGYGPVHGGEHTGWHYRLEQKSERFTAGDTAYALLRLNDLSRDFRLRTVTFRDGVQQYDHVGNWNDVGNGWGHAYHWPHWENVAVGAWEFRVYIDTGNGWQFVDTLSFTVRDRQVIVIQPEPQPEPQPDQTAAPRIRFDFNGRRDDGWTTGWDTWLPPQDQPDDNTWKVIAQGPNPGVVSPLLAAGFSAQRTPTLRFSVKARGAARQTLGQVYLMDANGWWGYETIFMPVAVDYNYHEYEVSLAHLGNVPIRRFSIELTQAAGYEEWIFDWIELQ